MLREFWGDLKKAIGAWRVAPLLPLLTLLFQLPWYLPPFHWSLGIAWFIGGLLYVGFVGTERLWYLAVWRGVHFEARRIWPTTCQYFPRFLGLWIVGTVVYAIFWIPISLVIGAVGLNPEGGHRLDTLLSIIPFDIWLTFMTPALAYSTDEVKEAMSIGWRFLKQHWRHCLPYALAPPLASLIFLQRTPEASIGLWPRLGLFAVGALAYLALKGATAAYYVRHHGTAIPDDEISVPTFPEVTALQKIRDRVQ